MKKNIYLILDNIRSRENVGSIFRTADAAGVSKIYLCGITPTPSVRNPKFQIQNQDKIAKTALGAETWVPWEYYKDTWRLLKHLNKGHVITIALEQTKNSQNIFKFRPKFPLALVLGNEVRGVSPKILKYCDKKIYIPMHGKKESLNVSVAAGVALYSLIS